MSKIASKPSLNDVGLQNSQTNLLPASQGSSKPLALLRPVIARAYGVGMDGKTILGGPNWIDSDAYHLQAKAAEPDKTTRAQLLLMLQTLLAERFRLKIP
jgi:uncharacterized protein (TIGR03435 family)